MKIFLTGANGMVGKNILAHNKANKYQFFNPSKNELNLISQKNVYNYIEKNSFDLIIHCAGLVGGILENTQNQDKFLIENFEIGKNVIQTARELNVKNLINLGSSCMYPKGINIPLKENILLSGELEPTNEGYALAKIAIAKLCDFISNKYEGYNYKSIIPCNLYGKWDRFDLQRSHMIPAAISKIHNAKEKNEKFIEIWGDGTAFREFMYAEDLSDAIYHIIELGLNNLDNFTNIGLGYDYTIKEYYETISKVIGFKGEFVYNLEKPVGMKRKLLDVSKQKEFNWNAKTSLVDGIKKTYDFFLERHNIRN